METFRGKCFFSFFPHHFKRNQNSFQEKKKKRKHETNQQVLFSHLCGTLQGVLIFLLAGSPHPLPPQESLMLGGGWWVVGGWWAGGANVCSFSFTHAASSLLSWPAKLGILEGKTVPLSGETLPPNPLTLGPGCGLPSPEGPPLPVAGEGAADCRWGR